LSVVNAVVRTTPAGAGITSESSTSKLYPSSVAYKRTSEFGVCDTVTEPASTFNTSRI
jgi:hypothetical protein